MPNATTGGGCAEIVADTDVEPLLRLPPQCAYEQSALDGFQRQQCVGRSLARRLLLEPDKGNHSQKAVVRASLCVANRLVRVRLLDDCHMVAHAVGSALWQRFSMRHETTTDAQLAEAARALIPLCPPQVCLDGCLHAIMSELVALAQQFGRLEASRPLVATACGPEMQALLMTGHDPSPWTYACYHGLGHGLGALIARGAFSFATGFQLCEALMAGERTFTASACEAGLLMQVTKNRHPHPHPQLPSCSPVAQLSRDRGYDCYSRHSLDGATFT